VSGAELSSRSHRSRTAVVAVAMCALGAWITAPRPPAAADCNGAGQFGAGAGCAPPGGGSSAQNWPPASVDWPPGGSDSDSGDKSDGGAAGSTAERTSRTASTPIVPVGPPVAVGTVAPTSKPIVLPAPSR